jgi:hypothetical protein
MHDGTGPWIPGTRPTDPIGGLARTRPALRLIKGKVTPRAAPRPALVRLDVERALRQRLHRSLVGVAFACAAGVVLALLLCAAVVAAASWLLQR